MIRLQPIIAIAQRDLYQELRGRRGWVLPFITALLIVPVASIPTERVASDDTPEIRMQGDIPEPILALPGATVVDERADLTFRQVPVDELKPSDPRSLLLVRGPPTPEVRATLDEQSGPSIRIEDVSKPLVFPRRSLILALIAASVLTGALSESISGERSRRTLEALLSAAVTRFEIVAGKWLAWAGYGSLAACLGGLGAVLSGRMEAGWWLIPLPTVAMGTVALGMYLVRRARDVVSGATITLRVLPAVLSILGLSAWFIGGSQPLVGALIPLGGALIATGDTWAGWAPPVLSAVSTLVTTGVLLNLTARDLEQVPPAPNPVTGQIRNAVVALAMLGTAWWIPILGPLLWTLAGNPNITETLPRGPGVLAGCMALGLITLVRAGQAMWPAKELGLRLPPAQVWSVAVAVGVGLALSASMTGLMPWPEDPLTAQARVRLAEGLEPAFAGVPMVVLAIVAQELVYRGWLQQRAGPILGTAVFVVVHGALDPVTTLVAGAALAGLTRLANGSVWPAVAARLTWVLIGLIPMALAPWLGALVGLGTVGLVLGLDWQRRLNQS